MSAVQFVVEHREIIAPIYPCSGRGRKVSVIEHGPNVATNQLVDDYEKHVDKCKKCQENKDKIPRFDVLSFGTHHIVDEGQE